MDKELSDFAYDTVATSLRERVFYCAREGMPLHLCALLQEKSQAEIEDLLNTHVDFMGVKSTPLMVASKHGRESTVRMLIERFMPPLKLEIEGTAKFDEYVIDGATALWCAAGAGHLDVVKRLVRAGATVNHSTKTQSTPLRAACFDGRLDIVKYLVRHGADIDKANKYNNTCLMICSYKGHLDVVQFLLESGAKVNAKALCGATALHFASECGHVDVVNTLIQHGAMITKNDNGLTPLQSAAERARAKVVEVLVNRPEVSRIHAIEAYELLGASFANDKEFYCSRKAYKYLHRAMKMRYDTEKGVLLKKLIPPVPAYDNWNESSTLEELESINGDAHSIHMEGLTVRERILGRQCPDVPHPVVFRGAVFADEANFDRCLALWRHALVLRQENSVALMKDLLRFAQVFSQMIHIGIELPLSEVCFVMEACSTELSRCLIRIHWPTDHADADNAVEEQESNVRTALYLVSEATRLLEINDVTEKERRRVGLAVYSLRDMRLKSGQTLLHLAVNRQTPVDDFHTSDVCQFPCVKTARLLMECGVEVDAVDNRGRTALHVVLNSYRISADDTRHSWAEALRAVVSELLHRGAHHDVMDNDRVTPLAAAKGSPAEQLIKRSINLNLTCLAAATLAAHDCQYDPKQVPQVLHGFLKSHGVRQQK